MSERLTKHFIVDAPTQAQADWVLQEAERTWEDLSIIADGFMTSHRQPTFGVGAVSIRLDNRPFRRPQIDVFGPRLQNDGREIYWNVAANPDSLHQDLGHFRREVARAFFRTAKVDQRLPTWSLEGIAEYVATGGRPERIGTPGPHPGTPSESTEVPWRIAADRLIVPAVDRRGAALWVHFFLLADEGSRAAEFALALADELGQHPLPEKIPVVHTQHIDAHMRRWRHPARDTLTNLAARQDTQQAIAKWLVDPRATEPELHWQDPPTLHITESAEQMLAALRLARRFAESKDTKSGTIPRTVILTASGDNPESGDGSSAHTWRRVDLRSLRGRLLQNPPPPWSMRGTHGRIVYSWRAEHARELIDTLSGSFQAWTNDGGAWMIQELGPDRPLRLTYLSPRSKGARPQVLIERVRGALVPDFPATATWNSPPRNLNGESKTEKI